MLRQFRRATGLTQHDLAERSGVSARAISDLERGINQRPQRETAVMLAGGLGLQDADRDGFIDAARRPLQEPRPALLSLPPMPPKPLLGRDDELRAIESALAGDRVHVLVLSGPGGVGKTRLATEAAHRLAGRFRDGVVFVRLEGLNDPEQVMPAIGSALHLREMGARNEVVERLASYLASQEMLLILDNLEHVLDAARELGDLIARVPNLKILVTSRETPRLSGERVLHVAPLPLPGLLANRTASDVFRSDETPAAVQVFVNNALERNPSLDTDPATPEGRANLASIAEICRRLDGLPLAIELAAAQSDVLSPAAILTMLNAAGMPFLDSGNRDQPARLQTMDAAIGWSYSRLSHDDQMLFRALAIFAGGFTLAAAERVAGASAGGQGERNGADGRHPVTSAPSPAIVRAISSLARQNLVVQEALAPDAPVPRFRMLEPLRLYALDRLRASGEEEEARRRHAVYFADAAEALDALTLGPDPEIWFEEQARELDNVRAAQDWALAHGEYHLTAHLVAYFAQFWLLRGLHGEGRRRVESAIRVDAEVAPADRWFLRFWAAIFAFDEGDVVAASGYAAQLLEIAEADDDLLGVGAGLTLLSQVAGSTPEGREDAVALARKAIDRLEPLGQDVWTASAWARLGIEYQHLGRLNEARDYFLRSLALRRRADCEGCTVYPLVLLGGVNLELGRPIEAVASFRECLVLAIKHGNKPLSIRSLLGLADVAWRHGADLEQAPIALRFFGAAEAVRRRHGFSWDDSMIATVERWQSSIGHVMEAAAVERAIDEGATLSDADILELVQTLRVALDTSPLDRNQDVPSLLAAMGSIE